MNTLLWLALVWTVLLLVVAVSRRDLDDALLEAGLVAMMATLLTGGTLRWSMMVLAVGLLIMRVIRRQSVKTP